MINKTCTEQELIQKMSQASSEIKLVCGVGNNAAWLVVLEAYGHAKEHPRFNQSIKGGKFVGWYFRRVMKLYHKYEDRLLNAPNKSLFHLAYMREKTRKKFGDISDRDYFEFWKATGGPVYTETRPMVTSLQNKYRLLLVNNGVLNADQVAWVMTAQTALELACAMYDMAINDCETVRGLPRDILEDFFGQFSMKHISKEWYNAMVILEPAIKPMKPSEMEEKNIDHGIRQLMEAWLDNDLLYRSNLATIEEYDEVFRTKGFQKKVLGEIADISERTQKFLDNNS